MVNEEHLTRLKQGVKAWNEWRKGHCSVLRQRCASAFQWVWRTASPAGSRGLQTIKDASRKTFERLHATPWRTIVRRYKAPVLVLGGVLLTVFFLMIIIKVPQWQAALWRGQPGVEPGDLPKLENDARTTLIQGLGGLALLLGLYFTLKNLQLTQDRQITEHYTRAVEQLGSDQLKVRLGAIYALERIAMDSERDYWPIIEILTAYVRENAPWKEEKQRSTEETSPREPQPTQSNQSPPKLATDIQAILTVLGRRTRMYGKGEDQRLNLGNTDLRGAKLQRAHLEGADLREAHLEEADLKEAHLEEADLRKAHLNGAALQTTHLEEADLREAHLNGADLAAALLNKADLWGAHLEGADLLWAHLEGATLQAAHLKGVDLATAYLKRVNLQAAHLNGASLRGAHLEGVDLEAAHLNGADLAGAHLEGANLAGALLNEADLWGAHLEGANLWAAYLGRARFSTIDQLSTVQTLYEAVLDVSLREQIERRYPYLLKEPQD